MTFIPNGNILNLGDVVHLTKDLSTLSGTFTAGTELICIGYGDRGYDFEDRFGNQLLETGLESDFYRKA